MATLKKQARDKGKEIRKATGLPLPDAMKCGKLIVRGRTYEIPTNLVRWVTWCSCCGPVEKYITGPRGEYRYM